MSSHHPSRDSTYHLRKKSTLASKPKKMPISNNEKSSSNADASTTKASDLPSATLNLSDTSETSTIRSPLSADLGSERVLNRMEEMSTMLSGKLDNVLCELNAIKDDLAQTQKTVSELETSVNFAGDKIAALEKEEIPKLKEKIKQQEEEIEGKLTQMEIHHRKQNLLVYGVPDKQNEDIIATVREILCHFLHVAPEDAGKILLTNAHRLPVPKHAKQIAGQSTPGPSPIIIRFSSMLDRDRLLRAFESQPRRQQNGASAAPGSEDQAYARVTIRSDLPLKLKRERGRLAAVAYRLRREDKVSTRIKLVGTKVVLQTRKNSTGGSQSTSWSTWSEE